MDMTGKLALSIIGTFLMGMTNAYSTQAPTNPLALIMAGLAPVGAYLVGLYQTSPRFKK